jgi:hypothetical protein
MLLDSPDLHFTQAYRDEESQDLELVQHVKHLQLS